MAQVHLFGTCAAAVLALAVPHTAAAQQDEPEWMACITEVGGADLPTRVLDDFLASEEVGPAVDGQMYSILSAAVFECGQRRDWLQEDSEAAFSYALGDLASQEASRRLGQIGVSNTFIDEMISLHRESLAGRDVGEAMNQAYQREMARGQIDPQEDAVLVHILVAHVNWAARRDQMPRPD